MARHFTCDRCGEPIPSGRTSFAARGSAVNDNRDWTLRLPDRDFDLCPDCGNSLREWLTCYPGATENKQADANA